MQNLLPHHDMPTTNKVPPLRLLPPAPRSLIGVEREVPYLLRGRDEEFSHIMEAVTADGATAYVIEGPPGTGKTALLSAVGAYAGKCGYTVLKFDASETNMASQVIKTLWEQFSSYGKPKSITKKPFRLTPTILEAIGLDLPMGHETIFEAIESTMENLQQYADLYHLQSRRTEGFIFIFDNAATWRDIEALPKDHADRKALKALCNALHDLVRYMNPRIPTLMLVAGTPGTVNTFEELTSGRLSIHTRYHLRGVDDIATQEIITDHLRLQNPDGTVMLTPDVIPTANLQAVNRYCEGNVWHATFIGQRLQEAYLKAPQRVMAKGEVQQLAKYARQEVYTSILHRLRKKRSAKKIAAFAYLAAAAQQRNNRLDPIQTEELLEVANRITKTDATIDEYVQWGVLEDRIIENCYSHRLLTDPGQDHYRIPIPSFGEHVLNRYPDDDTGTRTATVNAQLRTMPHVPAWTWRTYDNIKQFIDLPPDPLHGYVAGQAGTLHPDISGDEPCPRPLPPESEWHP